MWPPQIFLTLDFGILVLKDLKHKVQPFMAKKRAQYSAIQASVLHFGKLLWKPLQCIVVPFEAIWCAAMSPPCLPHKFRSVESSKPHLATTLLRKPLECLLSILLSSPIENKGNLGDGNGHFYQIESRCICPEIEGHLYEIDLCSSWVPTSVEKVLLLPVWRWELNDGVSF